jgi:hypothetical protein
MPEGNVHPAPIVIEKLWVPVPWMLESAIVLEFVLAKYA